MTTTAAATAARGKRGNIKTAAPAPAPKKPGLQNAERKTEERALAIHIGQRVRARRKALGMSQEQLGDKLQITFQQVQKYEKGTNRLSTPTLIKLAKVLDAPILYFLPVDGEAQRLMPDLPAPLLTRAENLASRVDRLADEIAGLVAELRKH